MRKTTLMLGLVAAALVALLVWNLGERQPPANGSVTETEAEQPAQPRGEPDEIDETAQTSELVPIPGSEPAADEVPVQVETQQYLADPEVAAQAAAVHEQVLTAARPCYANRPPDQAPAAPPPGFPDETMQELRLSYKVAIAGGTAQLVDVVQDASDLEDKRLEACIVEAVGALHWNTTDDDGSLRVSDTINVGDLQKRVTSATPPSPKPPLPRQGESIPPVGQVADGAPLGWRTPR